MMVAETEEVACLVKMTRIPWYVNDPPRYDSVLIFVIRYSSSVLTIPIAGYFDDGDDDYGDVYARRDQILRIEMI